LAVGIVGVCLVLALVPIALNAPWRTPSPASPGALAHFDRDGLAFDYPASWHLSVSGLNMHYITVLDFLGTGSGSASCATITPGPGDQFISGTQCGTDLQIKPGQVVVELSRSDGPPRVGPIDPTDPTQLSPYSGETFVTVGGLPAVFHDYAPGDSAGTLSASWTLSVPEQLISRYLVMATMKSPGLAEMQTQVRALVASIEYDPPAPVLDPADGPAMAAKGLAQARASEPGYECFSSVPGATATGTITQFPGYSALRMALPVTCTMTIESNVIGLWKMTLTWSWTAASDRSAGTLTETIWLAADGTMGARMGGPGPSEMPYWP
jgi:hypothetical protein